MFIAYNKNKTKACLICTRARNRDFLADLVFYFLPKAKTSGEDVYVDGLYIGCVTDLISLEKILEYADHYNIEYEEVPLIKETAKTKITPQYVITNGWTTING